MTGPKSLGRRFLAERRGPFCSAATATGTSTGKLNVAEAESSSSSLTVDRGVAATDGAAIGVGGLTDDWCLIQRLTFHRLPFVSQTVLPAALAISNGSENTGASLCALVGSFTRIQSPALNCGCTAWYLLS
jgi:hypothetical protein